MRIVLHQSPLSIFRHAIDGVSYDAQDHVPGVGDALHFDLVGVDAPRRLIPALVFVVSREWRLKFVAAHDHGPEYGVELHLTVASEMPAKTGTRRIHDNRKK